MNRRRFIQAGIQAAGAPAILRGQGRKPNLIFVLADDLGYGDLGCYGQKQVQTPNLDRMAAEGTMFTSAYAGSTVCAPSRCCLFTGLHTGHGQMRGNRPTWLRRQDFTMGEMLKRAGYRTAVFGKWSLGVLGTEGYPNEKGIDEWFGYFSQGHAHTYYPQVLLHNRRAVELRENWSGKPKVYAHDLFTERALEMVDKSGEDPFFMHLAYTIPHANNEMGRALGNGMEVPEDAPYSSKPWPQVEKNFAAMVTRMDRDMGRLFEALKRKGIDENTLVIFTSDNGPHREGGHDPDYFDSNGRVKGIKRDLYEGGIRVPAIARWPGKTPQGRKSDFPWAFWDVMPTFAELAGTAAPAGLDGQSIVPALMGRQQRPHEFLYWEFHEGGSKQAVRHGDWKAVRNRLKAPLELYDLSKDVGETENVAGANPGVVARIEKYLETARTEHAEYPMAEAPARR